MLTRRKLLILSAVMLAPLPSFAANSKIFSKDGIAVNGTDVVAYFTDSEAVTGSEEFSLEWNGAKWLFHSQENLDRFEANPENYAPQYGGHCAYAAAKGSLAPSVPEAWTIYNGKLYLNFSLKVRERWLKDPDGFISQADANWPSLNQ